MARRDPVTGRLLPGRFTVVTSQLSLARQLWRYGEPGLAERALALDDADAADVCIRASEMAEEQVPDRAWPGGPGHVRAALVLASIEHLEGAVRPPGRRRRLPEARLPVELQADEESRWEADVAVSAEIDRRR